MMTANARLIARQQELIHKLSWNSAMGCYTRKGMEHVIWPEKSHVTRFVIFFDVDGVHAINKAAGTYAVFDAKIKAVLSTVRSTDAVAGQWNSGDEFLILMIETENRKRMDPQGLIDRLNAELAKQGLTAVFAWREVKSSLLDENVDPAADEVLAVKNERGDTR